MILSKVVGDLQRSGIKFGPGLNCLAKGFSISISDTTLVNRYKFLTHVTLVLNIPGIVRRSSILGLRFAKTIHSSSKFTTFWGDLVKCEFLANFPLHTQILNVWIQFFTYKTGEFVG